MRTGKASRAEVMFDLALSAMVGAVVTAVPILCGAPDVVGTLVFVIVGLGVFGFMVKR